MNYLEFNLLNFFKSVVFEKYVLKVKLNGKQISA